MKINEIRQLAKNKKIEKIPSTKKMMIRAIQNEEGNANCFAIGSSSACGQDACIWRADCLKEDALQMAS